MRFSLQISALLTAFNFVRDKINTISFVYFRFDDTIGNKKREFLSCYR